jgi:hypothetical protein
MAGPYNASNTQTQVNVQIPSRNLVQNNSLKLALLNDVTATAPTDGSTIQYNSTSQKFVVQTLNRVNGGSY